MIFLEAFAPINSLLAHSEQEKASPTYAEPKAGGSVRLDDKMKSCSAVSAGKAKDIEGGILAALFFGRGCCSARDGRESLSEEMRNDGLSVQKSTQVYLRTNSLDQHCSRIDELREHTFQ